MYAVLPTDALTFGECGEAICGSSFPNDAEGIRNDGADDDEDPDEDVDDGSGGGAVVAGKKGKSVEETNANISSRSDIELTS